MQDYQHKTIWIIGASSGIGYHLAKELHSRGARLIVSARTETRLTELQNELNHNISVLPIDAANSQAVENAAQWFVENGIVIDSVIFMAAVYTPGRLDELSFEDIDQQFRINLNAAFYVIHAVLPIMKQQHNGQIALCASVAGYRGLPAGQPYSASKAAMINLAESLKLECSNTDIDVKLISPGFVRTPMTDKNEFKMPMIIEPQEAAKAIADGLLKSQFEIHFPKRFTLIMKMLRILPNACFFWLTKRWL